MRSHRCDAGVPLFTPLSGIIANAPSDLTTEEVMLGHTQKKYYMIGNSEWAKSILARLLDNEPQVVTPSNRQELSDTSVNTRAIMHTAHTVRDIVGGRCESNFEPSSQS